MFISIISILANFSSKFKNIFKHFEFSHYSGRVHCGKHNVMWSGVRPSVRPVGILTMTHQGQDTTTRQ